MAWEFAYSTHIGQRNEQQDRCAVFTRGRQHLLLVADGMGGQHKGAEAASRVLTTAQTLFQQRASFSFPEQLLETLCQQAHQKIRQHDKPEHGIAGSTIVALYLHDDSAYWTHIGDSRLYHFQGERLLFQTQDHTATSDSKKGLYMCLGGNNPIHPDTQAAGLTGNDMFVLCSDGFWNEITPQELLAQLQRPGSLQHHAQQLVERAIQRGGAYADNTTLIIARQTQSSRFWRFVSRWLD